MGRKMLKSVNYRKKNGTLYCNVLAYWRFAYICNENNY